MAQIFDFGWVEWMAVPLLYTMKWFHTVIPNWGIAIILGEISFLVETRRERAG